MLYTYHCQYCNAIILSEFNRRRYTRTCKLCRKKYDKELQHKWYLKVTEGKVKFRWGHAKTKKEMVDKLEDGYIRCILRYNKIPNKLITKELIEAQREILKAKRLIRKNEDETGITECRTCGVPMDKEKYRKEHKTLSYMCKPCMAKESKRRYHERTGSTTYHKTKGGNL